MISIARLENGIQNYAWGSHTAIAELLGQPAPSREPQAELLIGVHPSLPSVARGDELPDGGLPLDQLIAADPVAAMGATAARRFEDGLPFLLKYLAVGKPLSIQAHPNLQEARSGFAREDEAMIALDAPHRNYRDRNHKPEITVAVTPFLALKGFRPIADSVRLFRRVESPAISAAMAGLASAGDAGLEVFFTAIMTAPTDVQAAIVQAAAAAARAVLQTAEPDPAWQWVARLAEQYPDDVGVMCPLFLNLLRLEPGQALFTGPGELHAYLDGVGIELMANSDNVLRGGLTPKHMDVPELLSILQFEAGEPRLIEPVAVSATERRYKAPAAEFGLSTIDTRGVANGHRGDPAGLAILLCLAGSGRLGVPGGTPLPVRPGDAFVVTAAAGGYQVDGELLLYQATTGEIEL